MAKTGGGVHYAERPSVDGQTAAGEMALAFSLLHLGGQVSL